MPSLNALGEFKSSFKNIANERSDLEAQKLPYDDLALPKTEAPPFVFSRGDSSGAPADDSPDAGVSAPDAGISAPDAAGGDFDFSAFLNTIPGEDSPPSIDDLLQDAVPSETYDDGISADGESDAAISFDDLIPDSAPQADGDASLDDFLDSISQPSEDQSAGADEGGDFSTPDGLLSGFSDEMEEAPADFQSEDLKSGDFQSDDIQSDDFQSDDLKSGDFQSDDFQSDDFQSGDFPADGFPADSLPDGAAGDGLSIDDFNIDGLQAEGGADDTQPDNIDDGFNIDETPPDVSEDEPEEDFEAIDMGGESRDSDIKADDMSFAGSHDADVQGFDNTEAAPEEEEGIDLGGETFETPSSGGSDAGSFDDFNLDGLGDSQFGDSGTAESSFDSQLPDTDFSGSAGEEPSAGDFGSGFDSGLPDMDFSSGTDTGSDSGEMDITPDFASEDTGGTTMPDMSFDSGGGDSAGFDLGDFGSDFSSDSIDLHGHDDSHAGEDTGGGNFGSEDFGGDSDFEIPGLEEIFDKTKVDEISQPAEKKGFFRRRKKAKAEEIQAAEEDVEEISLSQDDVDKLLQTLSSYPLNLRVACEELIAEQVILPQQLSKLIRLLVNGAPVRETAAHAEQIIGKPIFIPKGYEKMTGAAFQDEQASFAYIFVHNFLPVLRLFAVIAAFLVSAGYLCYKFIYTPLHAESLYVRGYERIPAGEYQRANELFNQAFTIHRKKKWFYSYAEAFRDQRRYMLAEGKYDELLRYYPRDKKGVLDYAHLETYYLMNYDKANRLLQRQLLDYAPNDYQGLLAAGDNFLLWADSDSERFYDKYEDARFSYARLLEKNGWKPPIVERMMKYFIRTDNLKEVLNLRVWFEANEKKRPLSPESLAELGGYLLDKQLEKPKGVPNPYVESIESVRGMLLKAIREDPTLPEAHYHLSRYHHNLGNTYDERLTLINALRAFDMSRTESVRRRLYRVDTHFRYANLLVNNREFFAAEEQTIEGIKFYEDFMSRNLVPPSPQLGRLYALKGDLEYFVKSGDMNAALRDYHLAEGYGYAPPEIQYRIGAAYYQLGNWGNSLQYLFKASSELPLNRRLLYALGNAAYQRGDYFAAQGYYTRLLSMLENQLTRLPVRLPNDNPEFLELGERLMRAYNNAGVVYEGLSEQTGSREYRSRAMSLYSESANAWDAITRDPVSMERMRLADHPGAPGINLGYLNANNALRPSTNYKPEIFIRIDKDVLEPSKWEELAPFGGLVN